MPPASGVGRLQGQGKDRPDPALELLLQELVPRYRQQGRTALWLCSGVRISVWTALQMFKVGG